MLESNKIVIASLGEYGLSAKGIQWNLRKYWSLRVSTSCIYYWLRKQEIRLRDYRDGKSNMAQSFVKHVMKGY